MEQLLHPDLFTWIKLYAVEIAATIVFVVYIVVEARKAIRHLLRKDDDVVVTAPPYPTAKQGTGLPR